MKDSVNIVGMGVPVRNPKRTAKGNLLLEITGESKNVEKFSQTIKDKVLGMDMIVKKDQATVHVIEIDVNFTTYMVREGLAK